MTTKAIALACIFVTNSYSYEFSSQAEVSESPLSKLIEQPTVTTVFQDKSLVIWVGTQHGLHRFNGSDKRVYASGQVRENSIPVSDIRAITQDTEGNMLVATFGGGILISNPQDGSFQRFQHSALKNDRFITNLYSSKSGTIWTASESGVSRIHPSLIGGRDWFNSDHQDTIGNTILGFIENSVGNVIITTPDRLWLVKDEEEKLTSMDIPDEVLNNGANITAIAVASGDSLYIGSDKGNIFHLRVNPTSSSLTVEETLSITGSITKLLFKNDALWAGTNNGLFHIRSKHHPNDPFTIENSSLSNNHITEIYAGADMIWIGTYQGLNNISFPKFLTFNQANSGISNDVMAFEYDQYNTLWVGTYDGLFSFGPEMSLNNSISNNSGYLNIPDPRIMALASRKDQMWIGLRQAGLYIYNIKKGTGYKKRISDDENLSITTILHEGESTTWIGTYNNGLFRVKNGKTESFLSSKSLMEERVTIIIKLQNSDLLIGTETKIFRYLTKANKFEPIGLRFDKNLAAPIILSLKQDSKENIWIGTKDHGLFIWANQPTEHNSMPQMIPAGEEHLISQAIYSIEIDNGGNIWCSTQNGIVKLDPEGNFIARFDKSDGLQGNDFNFAASFLAPTGILYFGGINGFSLFNPSDVFAKKPPSKLLLTKMKYSDSNSVYSVDMPKIKGLQLTHKNYFVTFEFSVLDFIDPENNQFRYKLENFDPDWIDNGTRNTATYTNLPAGKYVFRVQGANSSEVWNREGISINVTVLPPPWFTWWAWCAYAGLVAFVLWLGKRTYDSYAITRRARDMAITMRENEERAYDDIQEHQELHDDLITLAHEHNVATLGLIRDFIEEQKKHLKDELAAESADRSIGIIASLERLEGCLFFQDNGLMADLRKYTDFIFSEKLETSKVEQESIITINDVTSDLIPADLASPVAIVISEAVENAMQHAFTESFSANYLQVSLSTEPDNPSCYTLSITDNGVGIPQNMTSGPANTMGLGIIQSTARKLNASIQISQQDGTQITLTFPTQLNNKVS